MRESLGRPGGARPAFSPGEPVTLTPDERKRARSQIACSLVNLGEFRLYWLPAHRRIACRSVTCERHFRVPDGAQLVGYYAAGGPPATEIVRDLAELLEAMPEPAARAPAEPAPPPAPEPRQDAKPAAPGLTWATPRFNW
jgi:hypothetical protein